VAEQRKRMTVAESCMGCLACEVACKQEHNLPVGPRWIRVFPDVQLSCNRVRACGAWSVPSLLPR
jgi:Fe-S-cluster-containing dehydrogenase component